MRKFGQEIIEATAGKKIHGTGAIPGGINRNLPIATRDRFLAQIDDMEDWAQDALALARDYTLDHDDLVADFGVLPVQPHVAGARGATARSTSITAGCARSTPSGGTIFDMLDYDDYHKVLIEDVRVWSYMKFPFIRELGPEDGWYRVGPLARMNTASFIDTPLANAAHRAICARDRRGAEHTRHWPTTGRG